MKGVAITQRVSVIPAYGERRDWLDQAWPPFLAACGLLPSVLPNVTAKAVAICDASDLEGPVLTGGNDLAALGGYATERDATENTLLDAVELRGLRVLGVYRGMQLIQQRCAIPLRRVTGDVTTRQIIRIHGGPAEVNSYHRFAALESCPPLEVWAVAADGVVKAICRSASSITGIMWHPERNTPFATTDAALRHRVFNLA
jgi:gamma-glutamyl-gamma-aminobutyrate hydrolase PuuD